VDEQHISRRYVQFFCQLRVHGKLVFLSVYLRREKKEISLSVSHCFFLAFVVDRKINSLSVCCIFLSVTDDRVNFFRPDGSTFSCRRSTDKKNTNRQRIISTNRKKLFFCRFIPGGFFSVGLPTEKSVF
jgi:hypothetical protein